MTAPAVVQATTFDTGSAVGLSCNSGARINTHANSFLMAIIVVHNDVGVSSVSDGGHNTWDLMFSISNATLNTNMEIWGTRGPTVALANATVTVTITGATSEVILCQFFELSGIELEGSNPLDVDHTNSPAGTSTSITSGTQSSSNAAAGEMIWGAFAGLGGTPSAVDLGGSAASVGYPGLTSEYHAASGTNPSMLSCQSINAGTTAWAFTMTVTNNNRYVAAVWSLLNQRYVAGSFAGSYSGTGLAELELPTGSFAGTFSSSGAVELQVASGTFAGTFSSSGAVELQLSAGTFAGTFSATGAIELAVAGAFTGTYAGTGAVALEVAGSFTGMLGDTGGVQLQVPTGTFAAVFTSTGAVALEVAGTFAGVYAGVGTASIVVAQGDFFLAM